MIICYIINSSAEESTPYIDCICFCLFYFEFSVLSDFCISCLETSRGSSFVSESLELIYIILRLIAFGLGSSFFFSSDTYIILSSLSSPINFSKSDYSFVFMTLTLYLYSCKLSELSLDFLSFWLVMNWESVRLLFFIELSSAFSC